MCNKLRTLTIISLFFGLWTSKNILFAFAITADVGKHSVVFPPGYHGLKYFPDEPPALIGTNPVRFLMVVENYTVLMQGITPESAVPVRKVFAPISQPSSFDNGYAGITSVHQDKKRKQLIGFYHAEDHYGMPRVPYNEDVQGGYWSIGIAVSKDNGMTFVEHQQLLRSSVSKKNATHPHQGIGDVCVISNADKTYLYAYYTDLTRRMNDERAMIGMARCRIRDATNPNSWFKFHNGDFKEKGLGGNESAVVPLPVGFPCEVIAPHVTYVPEWKKYLMVCNVVAGSDCDQQKAEKGGIFLCHSSDGISWTEPLKLVIGLPIPYKDKEYIGHPSLYLEEVESTKAKGWLLYCYSPRWGKESDGRTPHHLARRPIALTVSK